MSIFGRRPPRQVYRVYDEQEFLSEIDSRSIDEVAADPEAPGDPVAHPAPLTARPGVRRAARIAARGLLVAAAGALLGVLLVALLRTISGIGARPVRRPTASLQGPKRSGAPARAPGATIGRRRARARVRSMHLPAARAGWPLTGAPRRGDRGSTRSAQPELAPAPAVRAPSWSHTGAPAAEPAQAEFGFER